MFRIFVKLLNGFRKSVCCLCFTLIFSGCITPVVEQHKISEEDKHLPQKSMIESIVLNKGNETLDVVINGNGKLTYTAVKESFPLGVHVYFPDAGISDAFVPPKLPKGIGVSSIECFYSDDTEKTAQVKILLTKNYHYQAESNNDNGIHLSFFPATSPEQDGIAGKRGNVSLVEHDLFATGTTPETGAFDTDKLDGKNNPDRAVEDTVEHNKSSLLAAEPAILSDLELSTTENGASSISILTTKPVQHKVFRSPEDPFELRLNLFKVNISEQIKKQMQGSPVSAVGRIVPIENKWKNEVTVKIQLRERVPYRVVQEGTRLNLTFAPSSLDKIASLKALALKENAVMPQVGGKTTPSVNEGLDDGSNNQAGISADDSPASQGQAPAIENSRITTNNTIDVINEDDPNLLAEEDEAFNAVSDDTMAMTGMEEEEWLEDEPVYTGEKISLDFFETDIKNVFRILRTVSGDNFAIDKDVTGNVTLTLDKPVPWDQVLDLVLKMNGLGKVREGSIIRIATNETLKREDAQRQEKMAAMERDREQQKKLEPLITEYISINYSSAEGDIKPHLEKILTKERGQLSIDARTNTIILTDVRETIEKAKELIYRLDKVTPQIMISARIVEASKTFSRELGVNWKMSSKDVYRADLGGIYGFDVALNTPVDATSSGIGYTFSRLAGTPFVLDARLNASELSGDSKTISSPKILTLDNKMAKIEQGLDYGYQSGVDENGNPVISFKKIDLSLEVTPHVTPDKRVNMLLKISKNEISGFTSNVPSLSTNDAETELLVNDGNTIVIGGIVKSVTNESRTGFPFLSSLPFIGAAFRSDTNKESKNELLIFITPKIVQLEQIRNLGAETIQ